MKQAFDRTPAVTKISARQNVPFRYYVRELWERRGLVSVLAGRELKSSYEMNIVGFAWWLLEPLSLTLVYVVIVDFIFNSAEPAYPLFVLVALLPYKWLSSSLIGSMGVVRANSSLITDVYFPRALLPITEIAVGMAHFAVGLLVVPIFMAIYGIAPTWHLVYLPLVVVIQSVFILGLAYPVSVWGLNYRNLPGLTANILRLWFYLSPGIWALSRVKVPWHRIIVRLNPLTGLFEGYRGAILSHRAPGWDLAYTAGIGLLAVVLGGWYFMRREPQFGKQL